MACSTGTVAASVCPFLYIVTIQSVYNCTIFALHLEEMLQSFKNIFVNVPFEGVNPRNQKDNAPYAEEPYICFESMYI